MTKKSQTQPAEFPNMAAFAPFAETMMKSTELFAKSMQTLPAEWAGFISKRVRADAKLYSDCAQCQDWEELFAVQQKWLKETGDDYMNEANQMTALGQDLLNESAQVAREGMAAADTASKTH